jgi:hypothetical protein
MNRTSVFAGLVCAALAAACSSETKVGSTATALEFCKTLRGIAIEKEGLCLSVAPALLDSAKAQVDAGCSQMQAAVDAGRAVYDRAKGASCALALASRDACTALAHLEGDLPADCTSAFNGAITPGGACSSQGMECAGGYCTAFIPSCGEPVLSGQCVAWPTEGEPCPAFICAPGLACGGGGVCVALSSAGGPCPCQAKLYCDTTGATSTCKALKTSGFCQGGSSARPDTRAAASPAHACRSSAWAPAAGPRPSAVLDTTATPAPARAARYPHSDRHVCSHVPARPRSSGA